MLNKSLSHRQLICFSVILAVVGGTLFFSFFRSTPAVEAGSGGAGRLLLTGFGGVSIYAINADPNVGSESFDMVTNYPGNPTDHPSVANNGTVAFRFRSMGDDDYRVWAMDADGSNRRQLTFTRAVPTSDTSPTISPDGTMVAFISNRTTGDIGLQLFIVNTDGTNLRQVTPTDVENCGSNCFAYIEQFAWSGNSNVIVAGSQFYTDPVTNQRVLRYGLFSRDINSIGDANPPIKVTGGTAFANAQCLDVVGGNILYGNSNRLFVFDFGGNLLNQINGTSFNEQLLGPGSARFSPDGSRIGYMSRDNNGSLITMNLDGSNRVTANSNMGIAALSFWWTQGYAIPTPARLELTPSVLQIPNDGSSATISPALYDANGNLIFRSARFAVTCDATHPCSVPFNPFGGFQFSAFNKINLTNPSTTNIGYVTVCGTNIVQACSIVGLNRDINFAEINASVPITNTDGTGGPGVFTIRRSSSQAGATFNVDFTLGGTAIRDLDYALSISGNSVTIPPGVNTVDVSITPLRALGNKTVTMSITAGPGSTYLTVPTSDNGTVNIIDNGSASGPPYLSTITPDSGGNAGFVRVTARGQNIRPGASLKLVKNSQEILGINPNIDPNGLFITAGFDLAGAAPGRWTVVLVNIDNTTAQLVDAFAVVGVEDPVLDVSVNGPPQIRAAHYLSEYDIVYTNSGNVDAYGVMLMVTGVPVNLCHGESGCEGTTITTPLLDIPSIPGVPALPPEAAGASPITPFTREGAMLQVGAIQAFLPRIPAHASGVFRIKIRFNFIPQDDQLSIRATMMPPLLRSIPNPNMRGGIELRPFDDPSTVAQTCWSNALQAIFSCATNITLGNACARAAVGAMQTTAGVLALASTADQGQISGGYAAYNGAQWTWSAVSAVATCIGQTLPWSKYLAAASCLATVYDAARQCIAAIRTLPVQTVTSADPNEKFGVKGLSIENYVRGERLAYGINFENQASATAPAQEVVITDQLDMSTLDFSTFFLGQMTFGTTTIVPPPNLKNYSTVVDLRPGTDLLVSVNASLDQGTGLVTWQFTSLDPFTRAIPTDPQAGFLPPNTIGPEGQGGVLFYITPKSTVSAGTQVLNHASIIFDLNAPIITSEWLNTIDDSKPVSGVQPLAAQQSSTTFTVNWSGTDTGSGINDYTLYVSTNGGPFDPTVVSTTDTTTQFVGEYDTTYSFYTIARDHAGNTEGSKIVGEATTHTAAAPVTISGTVTYGNAIPTATRYVSNVQISGEGSPNVSIFTGGVGPNAGTYALSGFGSGSYTVTPTKTGGVNSITSFDAAKIAQHVTAVSSLIGNQLVVADTSGNGSVTSFDAGLIAKYVVSSPPYGNTGTWKFNPANRTYASITSNINGEDFSALLMGEVSGNWTNSGARSVRSSRPERSPAIQVPQMEAMPGAAVTVPVSITNAGEKGIISYEFDLRYDPSVIQPQSNSVDLMGTVSSDMSIAVNAEQPGVLRVAVYGPMPIAGSGVLFNLNFVAVGSPGSASTLMFDKMMFNEGEPKISVASGSVKLSTAVFD